MGKSNHDNTLQGQRISRSLLAISLAASLAAFGCTTNLNPGNGTPTRSPEVRTAPTAGVTSGGETTTPPVNPPMTSSYSRPEPLPTVSQRSIRRSAAEAAAIMADNQPSGGRYLGIVSPGTPGRGYHSDQIATFVPPALQTNPQLTLNASISSDPTSAINSVTAADAGVTTGGVTTGGVTSGVTVTGTADATPTTAATTVTPGMVAGTAPLPTFASANTPSVTAASVGLGRVTATGSRTATTAATTTTAASTATTTTANSTVRGGLSPVRIQRGTNGAVTVTNVGTSTRTTTTGRSQ